LAKFAFGLGTLQVLVTTFIFSAAALPPGGGIFTRILEFLTNAPQELVSIRSVDEVRRPCSHDMLAWYAYNGASIEHIRHMSCKKLV